MLIGLANGSLYLPADGTSQKYGIVTTRTHQHRLAEADEHVGSSGADHLRYRPNIADARALSRKSQQGGETT